MVQACEVTFQRGKKRFCCASSSVGPLRAVWISWRALTFCNFDLAGTRQPSRPPQAPSVFEIKRPGELLAMQPESL